MYLTELLHVHYPIFGLVYSSLWKISVNFSMFRVWRLIFLTIWRKKTVILEWTWFVLGSFKIRFAPWYLKVILVYCMIWSMSCLIFSIKNYKVKSLFTVHQLLSCELLYQCCKEQNRTEIKKPGAKGPQL